MAGVMLWLLVTFVDIHPYHVSVCDVEYNEEAKSLQMIHHIFLDDLEEALVTYGGKPLDIINPSSKLERDKLVKAYILENFSVTVNGKITEMDYLGHELEGDGLYSYIEMKGVKKIKDISVKNTILMSKFDDQINLVHINYQDKIRSMKLSDKHRSEAFVYE